MGEIACGGEIPLRGMKFASTANGWISSAKQISIGANIREAKYAHSRPDFISKLQIALKECYETEYWLELMQKAELISVESSKDTLHDCGVIRRMLISSINTAKKNA